MRNQVKFMKHFKEAQYSKAAKVVFEVVDRDVVLSQFSKTLRKSSFGCYSHLLGKYDNTIKQVSLNAISSSELRLIVLELSYAYNGRVRQILKQLLTYCLEKDTKFLFLGYVDLFLNADKQSKTSLEKEFLAQLAAKVWPEKKLVGVLYG